MPIRRYRGRYPKPTRDLFDLGLLRQFPTQVEVFLLRDHGVNVTYRFKGLTPEKFGQVAKILLEAAFEETERYDEDYKWKFARFDIQLNRTSKGRKSLPLTQTYTAGKHTDGRIMVYGPGYEVEDKIFLVDQVEKILDIPTRYTGKVKRQRPYTVVRMQICLRAGNLLVFAEEKEKEEEEDA